ncbi:MAG: hypothetical protein ABH869_02265 [Candidatus Omnitrophota bacterium]
MVKEDFIWSDEMCELCGIAKKTLQDPRWRKGVRIPVKKFGRSLVAARGEFAEWFNGRLKNA